MAAHNKAQIRKGHAGLANILVRKRNMMMNNRLRREISRRWRSRFALAIFIYAGIVIGLSLWGYIYCSGRVFSGREPLYPFISAFHHNWFLCFILILLVGCIVIACLMFHKIALLMEKITAAVGSLYHEPGTPVQLPRELEDVEYQLNQIRMTAEADRQKAHDAEQKKSDMLMYMAHDLKTPLTSVIGYMTLLNEEADLPEETRRRYLRIVLRKAEHLEELINGFFEITRFNFSHMVLEKSCVNMTVMVQQMLYEFQPVFDQKGLYFTFESDGDRFVYCDVEKMERVFDNLFKNVANYSYNNTEIHVALSKGKSLTEDKEASASKEQQAAADREEGMRMIVENHGRTIPEEKLAHIFDQFFRLDSARASNTGGSGLGLAVVKEIVQLHGGRVTCESEHETIRFIVELP